MTNVILADDEQVKTFMPHLDAMFSILPYKFKNNGPDKNKASLSSCMGLAYDQRYEKDTRTKYFAGQLTEEDVVIFLHFFKIESDTTDPMIAIQLFLQKYTSLRTME
jgi:hypothetical protein